MIFWDSSALVALLVEEPDSKTRAKQLFEVTFSLAALSSNSRCSESVGSFSVRGSSPHGFRPDGDSLTRE